MRKLLFAITITVATIFASCESKTASDTSTDTAVTDSTDNKDETDYGNGSTRTSGNSGH